MRNLFLALALSTLVGCGNQGFHYEVVVYSGGEKIQTYETYWPPTHSEGKWSFLDAKTGKYVETTGTVVVNIIDDGAAAK